MKIAFIILSIVSSIVIGGCEEFLPEREDPTYFIVSSMRPSIVATRTGESALDIYITIKNNFDETIQGYSTFSGSVELQWLVPPEDQFPIDYHRTIKITTANIHNAPKYNAATGILTFDPGDSVVLLVRWNLKMNDSTLIAPYLKYFVDTQCNVLRDGYPAKRRFSEPIALSISGNIRLFEKLAMLYPASFNISQCFMLPHQGDINPPNDPCRNFDAQNPCSLIGN